MLRGLILLVFVSAVATLALPFILSSIYVDERGITIPGRVHFKSETITVHYSGWNRSSEVTFEYSPPEMAGVSFFNVRLEPERYDALHTGDRVNLHYLRREDAPALPLSKVLREMHALPIVRLAGDRAFSGVRTLFTRKALLLCEVLAGILALLIVLRVTRSPLFAWILGISVVLGAAGLAIYDFPRPMARPTVEVRRGNGRVKSVDRIDRLFEESHDRGVSADQPVDVVGIEFIPEGRTEPVVAVDLIDSGSIPGLKEKTVVAIDYEARSPRTAYIQNATRNFVSRNIGGIAIQGLLWLVVAIVLYGGWVLASRAFNRLIGKPG
ncbi:MAG: hypothetical protein M3Z85_17900 [Acidobacteriota bacterium]|nr:hypothetical protein [Acidobacteriota bacterium]